jgi:hypothetical protein
MTRTRPLAAASVAHVTLLTAVAFPAVANGQLRSGGDESDALRGLRSVDVRADVAWDMAVTMRGGTIRSDFEQDVRDAFELGMTRTGVRLDGAAPARVDCAVSLRYVESDEPTVIVSRTVRLLKPEAPEEGLGRWVVGWSRGSTWEVRRDALAGSEVGRGCAAAFERDWRRANREIAVVRRTRSRVVLAINCRPDAPSTPRTNS